MAGDDDGERMASNFFEELRFVVNEYIDDRLIRSGLNLKQRRITPSDMFQTPEGVDSYISASTTNSETLRALAEKRFLDVNSLTIQDFMVILVYIGECLELRHQNTYTDVFQILNIRSLNDVNLRRIYFNVAKEIFSDGVTWAKVISLLAFSGALTVDCVLSGMSVYVTRIKNWCVEFIESDLLDWIKRNNGWVGMFDKFSDQYRPNYTKHLKHINMKMLSFGVSTFLVLCVLLFVLKNTAILR